VVVILLVLCDGWSRMGVEQGSGQEGRKEIVALFISCSVARGEWGDGDVVVVSGCGEGCRGWA
jgi:hypothetical protein